MLKSTLQHLRDAQATELEGEGAGQAGFTLIELMVVLLIIAILLAIAIPTFLGVTSGANDRAAQSNLTNAITEAAAVYQSNAQSYTPPTGTTLDVLMGSSAPEFNWVVSTGTSTDQNHISVEPFAVNGETTDQGVAFAVLSKTTTCWYAINMQQTPASGTGATAGTFYAQRGPSGKANCTAAYAVTNVASITGSNYSSAPQI